MLARPVACTPIPPRLHPGCSWRPAWQPFSKGDCFRAGQLGGGSLGRGGRAGERGGCGSLLGFRHPGVGDSSWGWVVPAGIQSCLCGVEMGGSSGTGQQNGPTCRHCCLVKGHVQRLSVSLHSLSHSALDIPKRKQGGNAWGREGAWKEQEGAEMERRGLVGYPVISQGSLGKEAPAYFLPVCPGWAGVCVTRESLCRHMRVPVCMGYRYSPGR